MTLGFKTQIKGKPTNFVEKILAGEKVTTIRVDKHNRWKVGRKIHFATGVRTSNHHHFAEGECTKVEEIEIVKLQDWKSYSLSFRVRVDGEVLSTKRIEELAKNDGFDSVADFFKWFNKDFQGKIIHFKVNGS